MTAKPAITVVIPTRDRSRLVLRALDSVARQSYPAADVVVVDDGSTDDTVAAVSRFDGLVRLVDGGGRGASAARNAGVAAARTEWVAFLDSDDLWHEDHLAIHADAIAATDGAASLYFSDAVLPEGGTAWSRSGFEPSPPRELAGSGDRWVLRPLQPMMTPAVVVARAAYLACGGQDPALPCREDTHLFLLLGLGGPACAVAAQTVTVTADGRGNRLTEQLPGSDTAYWIATARLYEDVARRFPALAPPLARELQRRLATAHWRLGRLAWRRGRRTAAGGQRVAQCAGRPIGDPRARRPTSMSARPRAPWLAARRGGSVRSRWPIALATRTASPWSRSTGCSRRTIRAGRRRIRATRSTAGSSRRAWRSSPPTTDVVSPDQVLAAQGGTALPERPLLVTIDDGWADTHDHALPELLRAEMRAVVFVTAGAVDAAAPFWPERVVAAARTGAIAGGPDAAPALVERLGRATPAMRERWLAGALPSLDPRSAPRLGTAAELRVVAAAMAIGGHGATHEPLAGHRDLDAELVESRQSLCRRLGPLGEGEPATMSFPHGAYDRAAVVAARSAGFRLLATSDPCLNRLDDGMLATDLIGRVGIPASAIVDGHGAVRDELLARWLWRRPRGVVKAP